MKHKILLFLSLVTSVISFSQFQNAIIAADGNSLTAGGETQPYSVWLKQKQPFDGAGVQIFNVAVGGQTTVEMANDAATQIDVRYNPNVPCILIAYEIGNDIYYNGSVVNAENNFKNYCLARKAAGWKVYVVTVTPRDMISGFGDSPAQYNAKVDLANLWLRDNYKSFADELIDLAADTRMQNTSNATYYVPDKVHYTNEGHKVFADAVYAKLMTTAEDTSVVVQPLVDTVQEEILDPIDSPTDTIPQYIFVRSSDTTKPFKIITIAGFALAKKNFLDAANSSCETARRTTAYLGVYLMPDKIRQVDWKKYVLEFSRNR